MENGRILKEVVRIAIYVKAIFSFMHVVVLTCGDRKKEENKDYKSRTRIFYKKLIIKNIRHWHRLKSKKRKNNVRMTCDFEMFNDS